MYQIRARLSTSRKSDQRDLSVILLTGIGIVPPGSDSNHMSARGSFGTIPHLHVIGTFYSNNETLIEFDLFTQVPALLET